MDKALSFTHSHTHNVEACPSGAIRVQCPAQGHFDMWTGGAEPPTLRLVNDPFCLLSLSPAMSSGSSRVNLRHSQSRLVKSLQCILDRPQVFSQLDPVSLHREASGQHIQMLKPPQLTFFQFEGGLVCLQAPSRYLIP